jgi:adenylosuccinate synthase
MPVKLVLGLQHGDEGKGRIVDDLVQTWADVIIRFQGGGNAGHTVYDRNGNKYVTHQLPVGVLNKNKINIISKGCVINPVDLFEEINLFKDLSPQIKISGLCPVIEPTHILKDKLKYQGKIGTTAKGIGPAYSDFYARDSLLFKDLVKNPYESLERIKNKFFEFQNYLKNSNLSLEENTLNNNIIFFEDWSEKYKKAVIFLQDLLLEDENLIQDLYKQNKNILLEGAQGYGLSIDSENYPNVTSSFPTIGGALNSTGLNHIQINEVIGVTKIYKTKVGSGDFNSRCNPEVEDLLAYHGKEYGATTGRPRKCGWLDLDEVYDAIQKNGVTHLCVIKSDVFSLVEDPFVYYNKQLLKIPKINSVSLLDESFKNILTFIKKATGVKNITFTSGPKRGEIQWNVKLNQEI